MSAPTSRPVPTFSSPLADALSRFLAFKRAAGCRYDDEARALGLLDQFLIATLNPDDPVITLDVVRSYVARRGEESETTRAHRLTLIRQVCRFIALEQPRTAVPAPRFLGIHRRAFVARVMSQEEGQRFLTACERLVSRSWSPMRDTVLGTALVPVLHRPADRRSAPAHHRRRGPGGRGAARTRHQVRQVSSGPARRRRHGAAGPLPHDHRAPSGRAPARRAVLFDRVRAWVSHTALSAAFRQVLAQAEIPRQSGGRTLRLHDLRHGFAVLRLLVWYQQDADLGARLPSLATYLGHVGLASSQRYLQLTADMVGEVARRHERRFGYLINEGGQP